MKMFSRSVERSSGSIRRLVDIREGDVADIFSLLARPPNEWDTLCGPATVSWSSGTDLGLEGAGARVYQLRRSDTELAVSMEKALIRTVRYAMCIQLFSGITLLLLPWTIAASPKRIDLPSIPMFMVFEAD